MIAEKFQTIGSTIQMGSDTVKDAVNNFKISCDICAKRGLPLTCKECGISTTHKMVIAALKDSEELK